MIVNLNLIPAKDKETDVCKKCQEVIVLEEESGYWDSFVGEINGKMYYTPYCYDGKDHETKGFEMHEPLNFVKDEKGFYFHKKLERR